MRRLLVVGFNNGGRSSWICVSVAVLQWYRLRRIGSREWRSCLSVRSYWCGGEAGDGSSYYTFPVLLNDQRFDADSYDRQRVRLDGLAVQGRVGCGMTAQVSVY